MRGGISGLGLSFSHRSLKRAALICFCLNRFVAHTVASHTLSLAQGEILQKWLSLNIYFMGLVGKRVGDVVPGVVVYLSSDG